MSITVVDMVKELRRYLDQIEVTSDNIGELRRVLMLPWDSEWNGIVRAETAQRENRKVEVFVD